MGAWVGQAATYIDFAKGLYLGLNILIFFFNCRSPPNKVIRPKSHASALSRQVRQTDKDFFFKKDIKNCYLLLNVPSPLFRDIKNAIKSLKQLCYGWNNGPMDQWTDGLTY